MPGAIGALSVQDSHRPLWNQYQPLSVSGERRLTAGSELPERAIESLVYGFLVEARVDIKTSISDMLIDKCDNSFQRRESVRAARQVVIFVLEFD